MLLNQNESHSLLDSMSEIKKTLSNGSGGKKTNPERQTGNKTRQTGLNLMINATTQSFCYAIHDQVIYCEEKYVLTTKLTVFIQVKKYIL